MDTIFLRYFIPGVVLFCMWGCKAAQKSTTSPDSSAVSYSLTYVIHGDGNYIYHDENGRRLQADEQQLQEAISVAKKATHGEVFIFHQRPEDQVLWLFPKKDRLFLHYKNGERVNKKRYSPLKNQEHFEKEAELYHRFRSSTPSKSIFLYYGHEIPGKRYTGYFQSRPEEVFDIQHFTDGVDSFLKAKEQFDLMVLSTCDNGTPAMVSALQGKTEYLIASPENLHLSHIDSESVLELEQPGKSIVEITHSIAESSFERLTNFLETVVTIAIYDMDHVRSTAKQLSNGYDHYRAEKEELSVEQENIDCAVLPLWTDNSNYSEGITVFFNPPAFGPQAQRESHSGWGCQP